MDLQSRYTNAVLLLLEESEVGQKMTVHSAPKACRVAGIARKLNSHCMAARTLFHHQSYKIRTHPAFYLA